MSRLTILTMMLAGAAAPGYGQLEIPEADAKRAAVVKPAPEYTMAARQMKAAGRVELEVAIGPDGAVQDVKIVAGNPLLTRSCAKTVQAWKFTPFQKDGQPTRAMAKLTFDFRP